MSEDLKGKVALITGANKGIGYEIARQLGSRGATVLVGARDIKRGEEAANKLRLNSQFCLLLNLKIPRLKSMLLTLVSQRLILINTKGIALLSKERSLRGATPTQQ
ncbi:MAG: SDR family NAD(P)-dependent oxidoreductase [Nostoc sp. ChiQUE02]|uniref:SDR family NAD(P)-dependent oxidoreductase n=1 Tax=Nostoc sp. ChiQUE02 TaxID=3075377 RepID=UPI002AD43869|nr:SDR family NAD(P)-dependent oxidoreductase [Nostoc sp. ChiQUE02]MDZ8232047.1 SDR family NAD(P)-dependent oxidoreductase [Nostoc sp. ChiQUE02]